MKKIILTFAILFLSYFGYSQGIAVQGIARDVNNTARASQTIALTFEIYYLEGGSPANIYSTTQSLTTDSFGVFSYVLDVPNNLEADFSNKQQFLKITEGATVISDEELKRVPYAYSASNGVPTGAIMPYMGTTAPEGWLLCDGTSIPGGNITYPLRTLLGQDTTPDLRGMFLRGAGVNNSRIGGSEGNALGTYQEGSVGTHNHNKGTLGTIENGEHRHSLDRYSTSESGDGTNSILTDDQNFGSTSANNAISLAGKHSHTITGATANNAENAHTRPANYGVNYIIKI